MKVDVKKVSSVSRELKFEVPKETVTPKFDEVYQDLSKEVKMKGFRKGKIPRNVLERHHRQRAEEEVIRKVVSEAYDEAIRKENLTPIDMPEIHDVLLKDGVITFTAKLDIKPEINIKTYKGIKIKRKSTDVSDDEINKTIDFYKQGQGKDKNFEVDDGFAKGLGFPSLDDFKKSLSRQLEMEKERQNKADVENQIVEFLLKQTKVEVPQSLVEKQLHRRIHDYEHQLQQQGLSKEEIQKKCEDSKDELKEAVHKDIQVYLILDRIAELEKMEIAQGESLPGKIMEFLLKEAQWEA